MQRILILYDNLLVGGVQTLIARLTGRLAGAGSEVAVLVRRAGDPELESAVARSGRLKRGSFRLGPRTGFFAERGAVPDIVLAFDSVSLTAAIARFGNCPGVRIGVWVLHPREFAARAAGRFRDRVASRLLAQMPAANVAFMNRACDQEHRAALPFSAEPRPLVPLPVDTARYQCLAPGSGGWGRLLTVGRLTAFKTYHRWMLEVVAELLRNGAPVRYEIYGEGPERSAIEERVRALGLEGAVHLHGAVPWSALPEIFSSGWAFAGMGTALVEAAAAGLPALITPESSAAPVTYGFLHESDGYEVGEFEPERRGEPPAARLRELLDPARYREHAARSRSRARDFAGEAVWPLVEEWLRGLGPARLELPAAYAVRDLAGSALARLRQQCGLESSDAKRYLRHDFPAHVFPSATGR